MRHVRDSLWEYTVPANQVVVPGIDFYIVATDTAGQQGKSPRIPNPNQEPYTIFIGNDIPVVKEVSIVCEDSTSDLKTFTFQLIDNNGIYGAQLYYKGLYDVIYQEYSFGSIFRDNTWRTMVPMNSLESDGFRYYLRVTDALGASVRYPETGSLTTDACEVKEFIPEPVDSNVVDTIPKDSIPKDTVPKDSTPKDSVPQDTSTTPSDSNMFTIDSLTPSPRDSIVYSLIADTAEIYDKDLDGRADFVRVWRCLEAGDFRVADDTEGVTAQAPAGMEPERFCLCLRVLREAGLLSGEGPLYGAAPVTIDGKADLEATETMRALRAL